MERWALGIGILDWGRWERCMDRFGAIYLDGCELDIKLLHDLEGCVGTLVAEVADVRDDERVWSSFGLPLLGQEICLGCGILFVLPAFESGMSSRVGLMPVDNKRSEWLNMQALFMAHGHKVRLWFLGDPSRKETSIISKAKQAGLEPEEWVRWAEASDTSTSTDPGHS